MTDVPHDSMTQHGGREKVTNTKNECKCGDWWDNIDLIDDIIVAAQIRANKAMELKPFKYCPWCGTQVTPTTLDD